MQINIYPLTSGASFHIFVISFVNSVVMWLNFSLQMYLFVQHKEYWPCKNTLYIESLLPICHTRYHGIYKQKMLYLIFLKNSIFKFYLVRSCKDRSGSVAPTFGDRTGETEPNGALGAQGQPGLQSKTLSPKKSKVAKFVKILKCLSECKFCYFYTFNSVDS